jgi:cytochrome P450 PksS
VKVDISNPKFKADPFPFYARLRAEAPVYPVTLPDGRNAWLITRYDDVAAILKDERFAKDPHNALSSEQLAGLPWMPSFFRPLSRNMLDLDSPDHTRLRGLVHKAFTPPLVEQMRGRVQALCDRLLDRAQGRGRLDLIREYAQPVPTTIIAELLGVPVADRHRFQRWSQTLVTLGSSRWGVVLAIPSVWLFLRYVRQLIRARRASPRDDLMSALIRVEEAGQQLSEDELVAMIFLLLVAGHETTVNLIGNGTLALLEHPSQLQKLRQQPDLVVLAVEELLRFTSPVETATERYAREDVTIAGVTVPRGGMVFAAIASANRDERQFVDPDRLDITRAPNKHLSFGLGAHYCLGAALARMEAQVALATLLRQAPGLRLGVELRMLRWRPGLVLRGLWALPVCIAKTTGSTAFPGC